MGNTHHLPEELRPIRVLFIVDSRYWVIGNFAHQVSKDNSGIEATTCSQFAIRKTIKRFGSFPKCFDVIHFLRTKTIQGFWGALPIVTTFHHFDPSIDFAPFHQSDGVMTVSSQWHKYLSKIGISTTQQNLVAFGVDTTQFYPPEDETRLKVRKTLHLPHDAFVLGFSSRRISNINNSKGVNCFLQALQRLHRRLPNLATLIIGPGWQALAKDIRQQGILCTQAPYEITHERIAKYYQAMDVFWVTSRVEGGPVPLLEAMATGLPCISTPVGAALDLINDKQNGFIVSFDCPDQFVDRSIQLEQDQNLRHRIGNEARKTILEERQWSQIQDKLQDLYTLAIKNFETKSNRNFSQIGFNKKNGETAENKLWQNPMPPEIFYSQKVQSWIQACELLNGLRMVVEMKEWKTACRFGYRALCTTPFDPGLWKELMSLFLKSKTPKDSRVMSPEPHTHLTSNHRL
jgi:glycosyltransferase involved in cell wall biosynthesis